MRRRVAAALMLLIAGCAQFPVTDEVRIAFSDNPHSVTVTAETTFQLTAQNDETRRRIDAARAAAQQGTDPWSLRFARLTPQSERVSWQKTRGLLERMTRTVEIDDQELQYVFGDANVTVNVLRGDGWRELRLYPGTSNRASRDQQRHFASELSSWSGAVARYFAAIHRLYAYMNENPGRAQYLFAAVMNENREDGSPPVVTEEEQPLVEAVLAAMEEIGERLDDQQDRAASFAEEADLIFNPFPARVIVDVPGSILSAEGFGSSKDRELVIEPVSLTGAIASLEGKWITPDPLAVMVREEPLTSAELAEKPRRSVAFVPASDVADAIREQLARPKTYTVRWRE